MDQSKEIKKIAYLTTSLSGGGAERNIINLCLNNKKKRYQSEIISLTNINDYKEEYRKEELSKLTIHVISKIKTTIPKKSPYFLISLFVNLFILLKKNKYELLIGAVETYPYYLAIFFALIFRLKSLLIVGNNMTAEIKSSYKSFQFFHRICLIISFKITTKIICVSKGVETDLIKNFFVSKEKIEVIYNGINIQKINHLSKENNTNKALYKKNYIVAFGRLIHKKGYFTLLKTFYLVSKLYPKMYLVIIGKGPLQLDLQLFSSALQINNKVIFLGFEKNPYSILIRAKLFLFSSLYEGFGNVIIEAMACGIPIITSDCLYGPKEICDNECIYAPNNDIYYGKYGVLVPPFSSNIEKNPEIFSYQEYLYAQAIQSLLEDKALYLKYKRESRKRANDFNLDRMVLKYNSVLEKLL